MFNGECIEEDLNMPTSKYNTSILQDIEYGKAHRLTTLKQRNNYFYDKCKDSVKDSNRPSMSLEIYKIGLSLYYSKLIVYVYFM